MTVLVLGDHLTREVGPVAERPDEPVLMIEAREFAERLPYHPHKLTLVFSAMRHYRDELRAAGREVHYHECETFADGFEAHFDTHPGDDLVLMRPASSGAADRLRDVVETAGGTLQVVENELFCCTRAAFDRWAADRDPPYRHEAFYRFMRRETGYLLDEGEPVGGEWNYDEANREFPGTDYDAPAPPTVEPDDLTEAVADWVAETFDGGYAEPPHGGDWADPGAFPWPVTRAQALEALDAFLEAHLAQFGPFQDAMVRDRWAMHHALLSPALNLGLLHPREVIEAAIEAYRTADEIPLQSVEGFVRQILGWREFVRHMYREGMPGLAAANRLEADRDLPDFYWTGDTDLACLNAVIDGVRTRGYSHHIQRLMLLSNFALLYGVEPAQLNRWFHAAYVDAFHWVTTPNVVEMGLFGSGEFATKPYAASANYVDGMSDYCTDCRYDPDKTTGEEACPFNALYWDFLDRQADRLRENSRMALVYSHLDRKDEAEREAIRDRAGRIRERIQRGEDPT